jgi:hypothetical protein
MILLPGTAFKGGSLHISYFRRLREAWMVSGPREPAS